jgi:hypothetical protein
MRGVALGGDSGVLGLPHAASAAIAARSLLTAQL